MNVTHTHNLCVHEDIGQARCTIPGCDFHIGLDELRAMKTVPIGTPRLTGPAGVKPQSDPNGLDAHAPGAKLDAGKPEAALLLDFSQALMEVAKVSTYGARKYSRGGWQHVDDGLRRYSDAMLRHLFLEKQDPRDEESGLMHAAQVAWNALARLELLLRLPPDVEKKQP